MTAADPIVRLTVPETPFSTAGVVTRADGSLAFADLEPSIGAMLRAAVDRAGPSEALVELDGRRLTYGQLWAAAGRVAGGFAARGVRRGDRVAIRLPNGVDWCLAFFGALLAGAVPVPVNPRFHEHEAQFVIGDCGAAYVVDPGDALPDGAPLWVDDQEHGDLAALFYTSGTTGFPKGAMLTHGSILAGLEVCQRSLQWPPSGIRTLVPLPLFHVMGALNQLLPTLRQSGTAVIMPVFEVQRWLSTMQAERINVVSAVPAIYFQALQLPDFATTDTSRVGWVIFGAAATPPEQVRRLAAGFPTARLYSGYGLTETSGGITGVPWTDAVERSTSVGLPLPTVQLALRGPRADQGQGELLVRAPQVMAGYWQRPAETASALAGGWLATGDVALVSPDGFVRIVDRIKDIVIRGGENVYCVEVESVLVNHPAIAEVAIIGVPDERLGERVGAVVVRLPGASLDGAQLRAWVAGQLSAYKVPEYVHVQDEPLPRNASGKVVKAQLRTGTPWAERLRG